MFMLYSLCLMSLSYVLMARNCRQRVVKSTWAPWSGSAQGARGQSRSSAAAFLCLFAKSLGQRPLTLKPCEATFRGGVHRAAHSAANVAPRVQGSGGVAHGFSELKKYILYSLNSISINFNSF